MKLDLLAIGTHPDDVELACGGTLALAAESGRRVGILHLTRGEMGTRGSAEERRVEAERAAEILGVAELAFLDCGDGGLRAGRGEEDAVIAELRRLRPEMVLIPPPEDRHPDHGRAHRLIREACFYAGLKLRQPAGTSSTSGVDPFRPGAVFHYMQHDIFAPAFIVDVTRVWELRQRALAAYGSQVYRDAEHAEHAEGGEKRSAPETKISSRDFWHAIEGRARHFGNQIGATFGEPFGSREALAVPDLLTLLPGGIR